MQYVIIVRVKNQMLFCELTKQSVSEMLNQSHSCVQLYIPVIFFFYNYK